MSLGSLVIELSANVARFQSDMGRAVHIAEQQAAQMNRFLGTVNAVFTGVAAGGLAFYVKGLIGAADQVERLSERTGIAVGQLSELKFAASLDDVGFEDLAKSIDIFNKNLVLASDSSSKQSRIFKELGVDIKAGPGEALKQFAASASQIDDASVRAAVFREAFGRAGDALIPVFKNLDQTTQQARALGITMTEETAKAAAQLERNLKTLKAQSDQLAVKFLSPAVEGLNSMAEAMLRGAENGNRWAVTMREIVNLAAATLGAAGSRGGALDTLAERAFEASLPQGSRLATGRIRQGGAVLGPVPGANKPDKNALAKIIAEQGNETKLYTNALQKLELELTAVNGLTERQRIEYETTVGSLEKLTDAHKKNLLVVATEIDSRKLLLASLKDEVDFQDRLNQAKIVAGAAKTAGNRALDDQAFEASLIGKTTVEVDKLRMAREADLQAAARAAAFNIEEFPKQNAEIFENSEAFKRQWSQAYDTIRAKARSWATGTQVAFNDYIDHATNAAEQSAMLFTDAFRSMEDAIVAFATTGKLSFRAFADSVVADIARILARQAIAAGASQLGLSALGGSLFGGAEEGPVQLAGPRASGGPVWPGSSFLVGENGPELFTPPSAGQVTPGGRGGPSVYIDARGADSAALAKVEQYMRSIDASIDTRAVAAVAHARMRNYLPA